MFGDGSKMKKNKFTRKVFQTANKLYWDEGYDQEDIASLFGCHQSSISRILKNEYTPIEDRRASRKQLHVHNFKAPRYEAKQAKTLRCKRETLNTTKLNVELAKEIRRSYFAGERDQRELATMHDVSQSAICRITTGRNWKICKC